MKPIKPNFIPKIIISKDIIQSEQNYMKKFTFKDIGVDTFIPTIPEIPHRL